MEEIQMEGELRNCEVKLRENPRRRKDKVRIGCGAGFGGDRPLAALKLLQRVEGLDYLVLECLAERTLADRYQIMAAGGEGYDPRISEWISTLLPLSVKKEVCIITNMGAIDPHGAQKQVVDIAKNLGLEITVALAYEMHQFQSGSPLMDEEHGIIKGAVSTYMGAAPIVECLEKYKPHVIVTSRVADAALFLGPMVYELGWNWNDFKLLAQGSLAGHLLECGCQLTGGYFMHPGDQNRVLSFQQLLDMSLPFAEVNLNGEVTVNKADGSGGLLDISTCAEQLLYEVGDPGAYVTPDVVIDFRDVKFHSLSHDKVLCSGTKPSEMLVPDKLLQLIPKVCGWKGWGEISYGGLECLKRAEAASFLVLSWMEEAYPGTRDHIISYVIGLDSLKANGIKDGILYSSKIRDVRLRMDGLFKLKEHAVNFVKEFTALYTNGPAGGGGISTGHKKEIVLLRRLIARESVFWKTEAKKLRIRCPGGGHTSSIDTVETRSMEGAATPVSESKPCDSRERLVENPVEPKLQQRPAPPGESIYLYEVAHSRAGDKGNDLNFSIIPHYPEDISRLKKIITSDWVLRVVSSLLDTSSFPDPLSIQKRNMWIKENVTVEIYEARGIHSLNVVVRNILDGGVNCSRRIDRHGKTVSDLILSQEVVLPPLSFER